MINFNNIKNKVSILFIFFSTLITSLVVGAQLFGIPYTEINGSIEDSRQEDILRLNQLADKLKYSVSQWIEERHKDIQFIGLSHDFSERSQALVEKTNIELLAAGDHAEDYNSSYLKLKFYIDESFHRLLTAYPEYSEIHLLHPKNGLAVASSDGKYLGKEILDPTAFSFIKNAFAPVSLLTKKSSHSGENNVMFALPTLQERDGATPILVFITPISNIQDILIQSQKELGETGEVLFVNSDGNGIRIQELGIEKLIETPRLRTALDAEVESTRKLDDSKGGFSLVSSRLIPVNQDQSISIFLKIDESILIRKREERLFAGILLAIFTVALSTTLIVIVMQRYLGPLLPLTTAAETIASGGYSTRVETIGANEVGRLEIAFNKMAEGIQEHVEDLAVARDVADNALKAKGEFLATMSHEIRTPMNGVIGMADLLSQSELTEDQRSMLNTIRDSGNSLLTVINDILDFSKIEAGKLDIESVPFSMSDVIEGAAATISPNASRKNVQIVTYVDPNISQTLFGDPVRLRQIIFNLTGNAVKFTEEGVVVVRADKISENDETVQVKISVVDQGIGISEDAQTKLFEAFSQADSSTTRRFGGTGLGLTICKSLIEIMEGEIAVKSQLGSGSTFSVELPLGISKNDKTPSNDINLAGVRVLVVTELDMLGYAIKRYLAHWGVEVHIVPNVIEIEAINPNPNTEPFNVILIDFNLSDDVQQNLLERYKSDSTKFIVLSDGQQRSARMSAPDTMTLDGNPLRQSQLIDAVAICVGRASPLVKADIDDEVIKAVEPLSVDEALAQGTLILLAEDNITNQKVIQRQLNMLGYTCEIADDGKLALKAWRDRDYGLLLTDCHMPHMDGFELTAAIRGDEEGTDMRAPIIAVTANALEGEAQRCIAGGMDDYLSKPLAMNDLKAMLKKWMPVAATLPSKNNAAKVPESIPDIPEEITSQAASSDGAIDPSALKSVFGDDEETFREILQEFVGPSTDNVKDINIAFENHSAADVASASHKLKSSSRSVGANELADICTELEAAGKNDDWDTINALVPRLPSVMQQVSAYIENL